jgi:hypothetical protein
MGESKKTINAGWAPMAFHAGLTNLDERFERDREQHCPREYHDAREGPAVLQAPAKQVALHGRLGLSDCERISMIVMSSLLGGQSELRLASNP